MSKKAWIWPMHISAFIWNKCSSIKCVCASLALLQPFVNMTTLNKKNWEKLFCAYPLSNTLRLKMMTTFSQIINHTWNHSSQLSQYLPFDKDSSTKTFVHLSALQLRNAQNWKSPHLWRSWPKDMRKDTCGQSQYASFLQTFDTHYSWGYISSYGIIFSSS